MVDPSFGDNDMTSPYLNKPLRTLANAYYDADVIIQPFYRRTGKPRKAWSELSESAQAAWSAWCYQVLIDNNERT